MSFNNVAIGTSKHPSAKFDFSHDYIGSARFGEVYPSSVRLLPTTGKSTIQTEQLVRFAPLARPAFGRMYLHQYHQFVPIEDLFKGFNHFLSRLRKMDDPSLGSQSIPSWIPSFNLGIIGDQLVKKGRARCTAYTRGAGNNDDTSKPWNPTVTGGNLQSNSTFPHNSSYPTGSATYWCTSETTNPVCDPESADFSVFLNNSVDLLWCVKFTNRGNRLKKILESCGYKLVFGTDCAIRVSALPLMAFYKAYWDIFHLTQYDNFEDTALYRLIKFYDVNGVQVLDLNITGTPSAYMLKLYDLWNDFFEELCDCFYSSNKDYVSAHQPMVSSDSIENDLDVLNDSFFQHQPFVDSSNAVTGRNAGNGATSIKVGSVTGFDHLDIEMLKKMYLWSNRRTAIGNDIEKVLVAKGLGQWCEENHERGYYIGSSRDPIAVSELLSTSQSTNADGSVSPLGDLGGQCSKYDSDSQLHFTNDKSGYIVSLWCIVPEPRQSGALDPTLLGIGSNDSYSAQYPEFYNPMYDGFGRESTPLACVGMDDYHLNLKHSGRQRLDGVFGEIARYTGYKVAQNVRTGVFSLASQRNTFAPFHTEKMIVRGLTGIDSVHYDDDGKLYTNDDSSDQLQDVVPLAGRGWRFPTRTEGLGNYNRIFLTGGIVSNNNEHNVETDKQFADDPIMMFMVYKHNAYQNMLPVAKSWDTLDEDEENSGDGATYVRN